MGQMEQLVTLQNALILGGYAFTWACFRMLSNKIDNLIDNHLAHMLKPKRRKRTK